jgi:ATP/maltotriose-dependent transcriptional regulator MalT
MNSIDTPILKTKRQPPILPSPALPRLELLESIFARNTRLTAVIAAAGYGKSTLAALLLHENAVRRPEYKSAWLTFDEDDNDPIRFMAALLLTLEHVAPEAVANARSVLYQREPRRAMLVLLASLEHPVNPCYLVLDDLHRLQALDVLDLLDILIERGPCSLHQVCLSRRNLPILQGRLRLRRELAYITEQQLKLTSSEVANYLLQVGNLMVNPETIHTVMRRTDGWIAGIHLILLSLQSYTFNLSIVEHLRGDNQFLAGYLMTEVLDQLDADMRTFLLRCAILEKLQPDLCAAVSGFKNSAALLADAANQRLFILPLDIQAEWFEIHQLFRELLLNELSRNYSATEIDALYQSAGDWFAKQGDVTSALHLLLAGHDSMSATALLRRCARAAILKNHLDELSHWLTLLPADVLAADPVLLLDRAWLMLLTAGQPLADAVQQAEHAIKKHPSPFQGWWEDVIVIRLWLRLLSPDQSDVCTDTLKALREISVDNHLARGWAWLVAALSSRQEVNAPALDYVHNGSAELSQSGFIAGQIYTLIVEAALNHHLGRLETVAVCQKGIAFIEAQERQHPSDIQAFCLQAGESCFWQDDVQEAALFFRKAYKNTPILDSRLNTLVVEEALTLCAALLDPINPMEIQAIETQEIRRLLSENQHTTFNVQYVYWRMLRWLAAGNTIKAWETFQLLNVTLDMLTLESPHMLWLVVLFAYVCCRLPTSIATDADVLRQSMSALSEHARNANWQFLAIQIQVLMVRLEQRLGKQARARFLLRRALADLEKTEFLRVVLIHPDLLPLLRVERSKIAQRLVARFDQHLASANPLTKLTQRQLQVLALLVRGYSIRHISHELVISENTAKMHLKNIYQILGVRCKAEAITLARQMGLPEN